MQLFKPALRRLEKEYRFLCSNLQFNRAYIYRKLCNNQVESAKFSSTATTKVRHYDTLTFGMCTDHVGGYKAGLLKYVFESLKEEQNLQKSNLNGSQNSSGVQSGSAVGWALDRQIS